MVSQLAQQGDVNLCNDLAGNAFPIVQTSTPGAPVSPNQLWVNATNASTISQWNGSAWVSIGTGASLTDMPLYIALLTQDPVQGGATTVAGLVELVIGGYSRALVTFSAASNSYPSTATNNNTLSFGPMSTTMTVPVQWAALVTTASGTTGQFLASWAMLSPLAVNQSQSISAGPGALTLQGQ